VVEGFVEEEEFLGVKEEEDLLLRLRRKKAAFDNERTVSEKKDFGARQKKKYQCKGGATPRGGRVFIWEGP